MVALDRRHRRPSRVAVAELVLKFDQNVPVVPGVPQVPLAESFAALNEYPDGQYRELKAAAAGYAGLRRANVVVGAGADDLILLVARTFLGPGRRASIVPPTYGLYRIATQLQAAELLTDGAAARGSMSPGGATRTTRPERSSRPPSWPSSRGRTLAAWSSSTRPTSSTAARAPRRSSTSCRTSSCCARSRRRSASPGFGSATRSRIPRRQRSWSPAGPRRRSPHPPRGSPPRRFATRVLAPRSRRDVTERERVRAALLAAAAMSSPRRRATSSGCRAIPPIADGARGSRASSSASSRRASASPCGDRPRTTCSSARSASTSRRRCAGTRGDLRPHHDRDGDADHPPPRRQRQARIQDRRRLPRPHAHAVRFPRRLRPRARWRAAICTSTSTTRSRT